MLPELKGKIDALAAEFAREILRLVGIAFRDLIDERAASRRERGVPSARSPKKIPAAKLPTAKRLFAAMDAADAQGSIAAAQEAIVAALRQRPKGVRGRDLRRVLGLPRRRFQHAIEQLHAAGRIRKRGSQQAMTYALTPATPTRSVGSSRTSSSR